MREIAWLQVSDLHMQQRDAWSQDLVLRALADSIRQRRNQGLTLDFILATGDLAFSGRKEEYDLVASFFDELVSATGVPKERIFCIPGNHDVNRKRQCLCFKGARAELTSPNAVDPVLAPDSDDLATLSQRQDAYRAFQTSYFGSQVRTVTPDGLAHVSSVSVAGVVIAIIGLNSAWLAEGGKDDHGNLLIGERQTINALDAAGKLDPHIVIAMAHHPLHLLSDFDRTACTKLIESRCDFYHCGHLHHPESYGSGFDATACLTVAAGASFETRESQNAYSLIKLDLLAGTRTLTTVQYNRFQTAFDSSSEMQFPIRLNPAALCSVDELGEAIAAYEPSLTSHSYYLAGLLMEQKTDVPIPAGGAHVFGTPSVLRQLQDDDYCRKVEAFLQFRNMLAVFCGRRLLADLLGEHGQAVRAYGVDLLSRCQSDAALAKRLAQQDADMRRLFAAQPTVSYAIESFAELVLSREWGLLAEQARRHLENPDERTRIQARRMLALALGNSTEPTYRNEAVDRYQALIRDRLAAAQDHSNLATLLLDMNRVDEAKTLVLEAIASSSGEALASLREVGHRIVSQSGDREFRERLKTALTGEGRP